MKLVQTLRNGLMKEWTFLLEKKNFSKKAIVVLPLDPCIQFL